MNMKRYQKITAISLISSSILLSSACSNQSASSTSCKKEEIKITFRSGGGTNKGLTDWLQQDIIPEFKKTHRLCLEDSA